MTTTVLLLGPQCCTCSGLSISSRRDVSGSLVSCSTSVTLAGVLYADCCSDCLNARNANCVQAVSHAVVNGSSHHGHAVTMYSRSSQASAGISSTVSTVRAGISGRPKTRFFLKNHEKRVFLRNARFDARPRRNARADWMPKCP